MAQPGEGKGGLSIAKGDVAPLRVARQTSPIYGTLTYTSDT
jgi:hypothetical protein